MGRIDPAPPRPGRGPGSPAGWIVAGVLAVALAAFVAFEAGKRSKTDAGPAIREAGSTAISAPSASSSAPTPAPESAALDRVSPQPPERFEHTIMEVTIPRPPPTRELAAEPTREPPPAPAETLHDTMARCLSFTAEDDEIHAVSMQHATQVRVTVTNGCNFSFPGSDVWFEARAVPRHNEGASAREVGRFIVPIEARGRAEVVVVLSCPMCYAATHRLEASLSWPPRDYQ